MTTIRGGDKLAAKLAELSKRVNRKATVRVGFLEGATYPDGTSVAMVAAIQNFGAPSRGIPPRPFFSNMVKEKGDGWGDALERLLLANDFDAERTLSLMGEGIAGQLEKSITETSSPPLSPITLMLRKMRSEDQSLVVTGATVGEAARRVAAGESTAGVSQKPLEDTLTLKRSIDFEVE